MTKHFMDIGANTGSTFDWLATQPHDYSDHVMWLFEPSPRHFAALIEKAKAMSGKYKINLCPFGLGGEAAAVHRLHEKDDPQGDSFFAQTASDHEPQNITGAFQVYAASVLASAFINGATEPGDELVLDIDAEGSEYTILEDILNNPSIAVRIKRLMVEFHFIGNNPIAAHDCALRKAQLIAGFAAHGIAIEVRGAVP